MFSVYKYIYGLILVQGKDYYTERTRTADFLTSLAEAICLMVSAVIFFKSYD